MAKVYSGIDYIDGLLSDSRQATTPVNSWSTATTVGSGVTLTYDWMTSAPGNAPAGGFQQFTLAQRSGAIAAMDLISDVANVDFNYSAFSTADIEFGTLAFGGSLFSGYTAGLASTSWTILGNPAFNTYYTHADVYLTNSFSTMANQTPGSAGFSTMLHEIGHALGLEHSFEGIPVPAGTDSEQYTVMSYTAHPSMNVNASTFMLHDIAALQYLYGANTTTRTGNDVYSWGTNEAEVMTIWDAGGNDTIDASNQTRDVTISLEAGTFSSIGSNGAGGDALNNIAVAYGAEIENATGGSGDDELIGSSGNNVLRGGAGADTMTGGLGYDFYYVDNAGDTVDEVTGGGGIADYIFSTVSFTATSGIERLYLQGTDNINATGSNGQNDLLLGNSGNNILDGKDGADYMRGGLGNDFYYVDNAYDRVDEVNGGGGVADFIFSSTSFAVAEGIERLYLTGTAPGVTYGIGRADQNDILVGGAGSNALLGNLGNDAIIGGAGKDYFRFNTALDGVNNVDTIYDFNSVDDQFQLEDAIFTGISSGILSASGFQQGAVANDADDRIIYNSATGEIYYDADGSGAAAQVQFAAVTAGTVLDESDFQIY